jgi:putative addiction module component (TIGR02574 family)
MTMPAIDIEKLTTEQRLHLLEVLWESLRKVPDALPLTQAHREELDRRLDELDQGDVATIPWEEVKRQLHGRKQRSR